VTRGAAWLLAGALAAAPAGASALDFEPRLTIAPESAARTVALTLDACSGAVDHRILDALIETRTRATIFVTHRWLKRNAAALATLRAHADLFEIENHGDQHVPVVTDATTVFGLKTAATPEAVRAEVEGGAQAVEAATGTRPRWFRGATARYSRDALDLIQASGYSVAGYSLNADQGASLPAAEVGRRIAAAKTGDVIIAHVNQPTHPSGAGVAEGVRALAKAGFVFVRLDEAKTISEDGPSIPRAAGAGRSELQARSRPPAR
jgi:peptidoglycan/xylan/chitin deacetylase (PgdA/CDA1 family)